MSLRERVGAAWTALAGKDTNKLQTDPIGYPAESFYPYFMGDEYGLEMIDTLVAEQGLAIYREMIDRDEQVAACTALPVLARVSTDLKISESGNEEIDKEVAKFCRYVMEDLDESSVVRLGEDTFEALPLSFSLIEKVWRDPYTTGDWVGKQGYRTFRPLPQETVTVKRDARGDIEPDGIWQAKPPNVVSSTDPTYFDKFPRDRFILWAWRRQWGNQLGKSILRPAYRWYIAKDKMVHWWLRYLEHHGHPFFLGEVDATANETTKTQALAQMKNLLFSHRAVFPAGMPIHIEQNSQHAAAHQAFKEICEVANKGIAKACLLPPTILDVGDGGSFALATAQQTPFLWFLNNMGKKFSDEVMKEQVLRPLIRHNFGENAPTPDVKYDDFDKGDLVAIATMFSILHKMKFPISKQDIAEALGRQIPGEDEEILDPPSEAPAPMANPFGSAEESIEEGEMLDALAEDLIRTSADPTRCDYIDTLRGNGKKTKQHRDQILEGIGS